jgi:hypothetical protein
MQELTWTTTAGSSGEWAEEITMAPNTKRVFYVKYLPSAVYPTVLAK